MRRFAALVLSLGLAGLVWGAHAAGAEQDEAPFRGLIPGDALTDTELNEFHGRGVTSSSRSGSGSFSGSGSLSDRNLREILMGAFRRAGVRPPLAPSGPNGTAGGGPIPTADIPSVSVDIPRVRVPSVPRTGSGSSSSSGSWSSSSF